MSQILLTDEQAKAAGEEIARDFNLKRDREHKDRFVTDSGTFTAIGIARRAFRMIQDSIAANPEKNRCGMCEHVFDGAAEVCPSCKSDEIEIRSDLK